METGDLPAGTVTFLFTDLEGSTRLLEAHPAAYREAVRRHHELLRDAVEAQGGVVFETVGDAVYAAFTGPTDAVAAALAGQLALHGEAWGETGPLRARMGVHLGEAERQGGHYFGAPLYRCARLTAAAVRGLRAGQRRSRTAQEEGTGSPGSLPVAMLHRDGSPAAVGRWRPSYPLTRRCVLTFPAPAPVSWALGPAAAAGPPTAIPRRPRATTPPSAIRRRWRRPVRRAEGRGRGVGSIGAPPARRRRRVARGLPAVCAGRACQGDSGRRTGR